jgi:hypothetical protein
MTVTSRFFDERRPIAAMQFPSPFPNPPLTDSPSPQPPDYFETFVGAPAAMRVIDPQPGKLLRAITYADT